MIEEPEEEIHYEKCGDVIKDSAGFSSRFMVFYVRLSSRFFLSEGVKYLITTVYYVIPGDSVGNVKYFKNDYFSSLFRVEFG